MKLIVTLLARNEEDIIGENIKFHLDHGADFIIVTDNLSTDGTADILRDYEKDGVIEVIKESSDTHDQSDWVTRMARLAYDKYQADWVINADADEFWFPLGGSLKDSLSQVPPGFGSADVWINNFAIVDGDEPFWQRLIFREVDYEYYLGGHASGRVCHRGRSDIFVFDGNHAVLYTDDHYEQSIPILILHFPVRSYAQFERKIITGARALANRPERHSSVGNQWRTAYLAQQAGRLREDIYDPMLRDIPKELEEGTLVMDTRLRDYFSENLK